MTSNSTLTSEHYECSLTAKRVVISYFLVSLPGVPLAPSKTKFSCSGMPTCGQLLGTPPCPYRQSVP
jgi:hypothetical protein